MELEASPKFLLAKISSPFILCTRPENCVFLIKQTSIFAAPSRTKNYAYTHKKKQIFFNVIEIQAVKILISYDPRCGH